MNLSTLYARTFLTTLLDMGVTHFVACPGSRNAPLLYALAALAQQNPNIVSHVRIDERNASFTALGIAKNSKKPVAIITTSGTAVPQMHAAVLEAHHAHIPLLLITADRPHHMHGIGANQTTEQENIFGNSCRLNLNLPSFMGTENQLNSLINNTKRAVSAAAGKRTNNPGPVQINIAFEEPLTPNVALNCVFPQTQITKVESVPLCFTPNGTAEFANTILVAGDSTNRNIQQYVQTNRIPLLAEPSSNVRYGSNAISFYHLVLKHFHTQIQRIIVCGKPTLSREITRLLLQKNVEIWVVDPYGQNWVDISNNAKLIVSDIQQLPKTLPQKKQWLEAWTDVSWEVTATFNKKIALFQHLSGLHVAKQLWETVQQQGAQLPQNLVVGASSIIRDLDLVAQNVATKNVSNVNVFANRGLAGIDGTISTAMGVALANKPTKTFTRLLVGDLTFLHDVGGLFLGQAEPAPDLQIIVVNDQGGSIFCRLEHGELHKNPTYKAIVERFFTTPHCVDIQKIAQAYNVSYTKTENLSQLQQCLRNPQTKISIIEVVINPEQAQKIYAEMF